MPVERAAGDEQQGKARRVMPDDEIERQEDERREEVRNELLEGGAHASPHERDIRPVHAIAARANPGH